MLLTRDQFREAVFKRDKDKCVVCGALAKDAHHILERRLWPDGGYYLDNGASVCEEHHLACERTDISVEEIRQYAGIQKKVLPPHFYDDQIYDKWGNIILQNGQRLKGELFYEDTVQKILKERLNDFSSYVKYPRTYHFPWSPGLVDDDRALGSCNHFVGKRVVITEKMDGENTSIYKDFCHARAIFNDPHPSRTWVKNFAATFQHDIPEGWRICGENLYAKHSIKYRDLSTYFFGFSIWNEHNICLSYDETIVWFKLLGIKPVPVLYDGIFDENDVRILDSRLDLQKSEGYVLRLADAFTYRDFRNSVAKFVRADHVLTSQHWKNRRLERNELYALTARESEEARRTSFHVDKEDS